MDLIDILKKLRHLEADPGYTKHARRLILRSKEAHRGSLTFGQFLINAFQTGSTIVLAGLLLILIVGGFSAGKLLTPFRLSSLNPDSLKVEAEAIGIQIRLADLSYRDSAALIIVSPNAETTIATSAISFATPLIEVNQLEIEEKLMQQAEELGLTVTSDEDDAITIDAALEQLSE